MEQSEYDRFLADACGVVGMLSKYKIDNVMEAEGAGELQMAVNGEYDEFKARVDRLNSYNNPFMSADWPETEQRLVQTPQETRECLSGFCPAPLEDVENSLVDRVFDVVQSHPALVEYAGLGGEWNLSSPPFQLHFDFLEKNPDFLLKLEAAGEDSKKIADEYRQAFGQA